MEKTRRGSQDDPDGWRPPARFDDFDVIRPLGRGAMGLVFLGEDRVLQRPVALKLIAGDVDDVARERFLAEARALARLHHPNVVQVFRVGWVEDRPYLAYEYVPGQTLRALPTPLPVLDVLRIAVGLARGLAAVHRRGILHRDVKPANIIVDESGEPKLIDFGVARAAGAEERVAEAPAASTELGHGSRSLTRSGHVIGTPLYMAPELFLGSPASVASDLYSLGLVLYELLSGILPYESATLPERAERLSREPPLRPPTEAPAPFVDLVMRCLDPSPARRPASADELRDGLELLASYYTPFGQLAPSRGDAPSGPELAARDAIAASIERLGARADELAARFFDDLLPRAPALRALFAEDAAERSAQLWGALRVASGLLGSPSQLVPMLESIGRRYHGAGIGTGDLATLGEALLGSIAAIEGERFTPELELAWRTVYERIAQAVARGAEIARLGQCETVGSVGVALRTSGVGASGTAPAVNHSTGRAPAPPRTRYATRGDVSIAYQVLGDGPVDLVLVPGFVSHVELSWQYEPFARFLRDLASFSRLIVYDKRGVGLSDRTRLMVSMDEHAADLASVLDAVGSERATVFGMSDGCAAALLFGATRPERTRSVIAYGVNVRMLSSPDYPFGLDPAFFEAVLERFRAEWGGPVFAELEAPSLASDPAFREFWASYLRSGGSLAGAISVLRTSSKMDARGLLPEVRVPTLVLHREQDQLAPLPGAAIAAELLPRGRLAALPGADHVPFAGDVRALVSEIRRFLEEPETAPELALTPYVQLSAPAPSELEAAPSAVSVAPDQWLFERSVDAIRFARAAIAAHPGLGARAGLAPLPLRWDADLSEELRARAALLPAPAPGEVHADELARATALGSGLRFTEIEGGCARVVGDDPKLE